MSDISRLVTLYHRLRGFFRIDREGDLIGVRVTEADMNAAVSPSNVVKGVGVVTIYAQDVAPSSPQEGDIWIDTST